MQIVADTVGVNVSNNGISEQFNDYRSLIRIDNINSGLIKVDHLGASEYAWVRSKYAKYARIAANAAHSHLGYKNSDATAGEKLLLISTGIACQKSIWV